MKNFIFRLLISLCPIISTIQAMDANSTYERSYVGAPCLLDIPSELKKTILFLVEQDPESLYTLSQTSESMRKFFKTIPVHLNLTYLSSDRELRDADLKRYIIQFPRAISVDLNILFLSMQGIEMLNGLSDLRSLQTICQYNGPLPATKLRAEAYASSDQKPYCSPPADSVLTLKEIQENSPAFYSHEEDQARDPKTSDEYVQEMEVRRLISCEFTNLLFFNIDMVLVLNIIHYNLVAKYFKPNLSDIDSYLTRRLEIKNIESKIGIIGPSYTRKKDVLALELMKKINSFCFFDQLDHLSCPVFVDYPFMKEHEKMLSLDISKNCSPTSSISPFNLNLFSRVPFLRSLKMHSWCIMSCVTSPLFFIDQLKNLKNIDLYHDREHPVHKEIIDQLEVLKKERKEFDYKIVEEDDKLN